jgi:predicted RNase H-like HicB family nuclease
MNELAYYVNLPYATTITPDECGDHPCYMAEHPDLYGCMAQGDTPEEAIQNLREAREDYIAALLDAGIAIPIPNGTPPMSTRN